MRLADGLSEVDQLWLDDWQRHLLRSPDQFDPATAIDRSKIYKDPALFNSPVKYGSFLNGLKDRGMLRWRVAGSELGSLGLFFCREEERFSAQCWTRVI